jgi:hypothetical protein
VKIAQHFSAGEAMREENMSPVGTTEIFNRPYGTQIKFVCLIPSNKLLGYYQKPLTGLFQSASKIELNA